MGWYIRKSVKIGPFRINLSKSGIGYSFGVKGARIGTGPRGPYVAGGRDGIYFRQSLGKTSATPSALPASPPSITIQQAQYCEHCGAQWIGDNRYCIQCGHEATVAPAATVPDTPKRPALWFWLVALIAGVSLIAYFGNFSKSNSNHAAQPPSATQSGAAFSLNTDFWVQQQTASRVTITVPGDTSVDKLESIVRFFKMKIKSGAFGELGITKPTHTGASGQAGDFSAGKNRVQKRRVDHSTVRFW